MDVGSSLSRETSKGLLKNTVNEAFKKFKGPALKNLENALARSPDRRRLWRTLKVVNDLEDEIGKDPSYINWLFMDRNSVFCSMKWNHRFREAIDARDEKPSEESKEAPVSEEGVKDEPGTVDGQAV
jgi:hypothetical protein